MPSGESHPKYDKNFRALLEANIKTEIRLHNIAIDIEISKSFVYQMRLHINTFNSIKAASFLSRPLMRPTRRVTLCKAVNQPYRRSATLWD